MTAPRPIRIDRFDDGSDAWEMAHAPAASSLTPFIAGYSDYSERTASFTTRRELPSLGAVLIVNLGEPIAVTGGNGVRVSLPAGHGFVAGIHDRHALSESTGQQSGVHVWLTMRGLHRLLGRGASQCANHTLPLQEMLGADALHLGEMLAEAPTREARFRQLDATFAKWMAGSPDMRRDVAWAFETIRNDPARHIADIAAEIGYSRKTLALHFCGQFGVTPKTASRIARFERAVAGASGTLAAWSAIAADAGYFDQPHMIREFVEFTGLTPSQYRARLRPANGGLVES